MAPLDRCEQGTLPRDRRARAARQQAEAIVEPFGELRDRERAHARGRQLERERDPVEPATDPRNRSGRARIEREVRVRRARALDEEPPRVGREHALRVGLVLGGEREGRDPPARLALDSERLAARRQHAHVRASGEHGVDDDRARGEQVLAVVEHEQEIRLRQPMRQDFERGRAGGLGQPARGDDDARYLLVRREAGELDPDHAVGVATHAVLGDGVREPRLARSARAGDRDHARAVEQLTDLATLALATDQ